MLNGCVTRLVSERPKLELSEVILMQVALLQFASQCYPGRLEYVNHCIGEKSLLVFDFDARVRFGLARRQKPARLSFCAGFSIRSKSTGCLFDGLSLQPQ